ncbi:MAG: aspartate kinase [Methanophagales archaeon ANME-1-THS]|nr:MAG: aspartate kinase [Methanophagales archaeon ANME-1-THS]
MRVVMKFGGVAVANGERIKRVAHLIQQFKDEEERKEGKRAEIVVVISALSKVTDMLLENASRVATEGNLEKVKVFVEEVRAKHELAASEAIANENELIRVKDELKERIAEMEKAMIGICLLGELSPRSLDYISSYGERLAAPILAGTLRAMGMEAVHLTGGEAGIITNEEYGNAQLTWGAEREIRDKIMPLLEDRIPVVTGFIGETKKKTVTTLGRGGSDYTATIIGAAIDADEIWLWKETEGIMSADPKIVRNARKLPYLSYIEAMELSYFGASVLHPRAMEPVMRKKIPIRVKNLSKPEDAGTLIGTEPEKTTKAAKAITFIENISILNIAGSGMRSISEVAARIFSALAAKNVDIIMISQGSSEMTISLVIATSQLDRAIGAIQSIDSGGAVIRDFSSNSNVCAVGVVGAGMAGIPGVAGKVFSALGKEGISVIMISQGSSEFNISFVVKKEEAYRAAQAIHDVFEMGA